MLGLETVKFNILSSGCLLYWAKGENGFARSPIVLILVETALVYVRHGLGYLSLPLRDNRQFIYHFMAVSL